MIPTSEVRDTIADAAKRAFQAESATRQRGPYVLGMSTLGRCTRQLGYVLAGTPASDTPPVREGRAANLGTWEHEGLNPRIAEILVEHDAKCETELTATIAGHQFIGHADIEVDNGIIDLKTVGEYKLSKVRLNGPFPEHLLQVGAYALARLQAGRPVDWIVIYYLDRANGDEEIIVIPVTRALLLDVIERVNVISMALDQPETLPRMSASGWSNAGPGASFTCDECHFLRHCWGPDAQPGKPVRVQAKSLEDPEAHSVLAEYLAAQQEEAAAKRRKDAAKARMVDMQPGQYTQPGQPTLSLTRGKPIEKFDQGQAKVLLAKLGAPMPMAICAGQTRVRAVKNEK